MIPWHLSNVNETESDAYLKLSYENMWPYFEELNIPWNKKERRSYLAKSDLQKISDPTSGEIFGYILLYTEEESLYIYDLQLYEKYRNKGLGTELIKLIINKSKTENKNLRLGTFKINPATDLYLHLGFNIIKTNQIFNWFQLETKNVIIE
ncbi:MAG: GNAT family N-acetyltransferase [Agarilytica sp.]